MARRRLPSISGCVVTSASVARWSPSFSGDNWLSIDSSAGSYNGTKNIVASFTRTGSAVSVQTIAIDTSSMDLFDANATPTRFYRLVTPRR